MPLNPDALTGFDSDDWQPPEPEQRRVERKPRPKAKDKAAAPKATTPAPTGIADQIATAVAKNAVTHVPSADVQLVMRACGAGVYQSVHEQHTAIIGVARELPGWSISVSPVAAVKETRERIDGTKFGPKTPQAAALLAIDTLRRTPHTATQPLLVVVNADTADDVDPQALADAGAGVCVLTN